MKKLLKGILFIITLLGCMSAYAAENGNMIFSDDFTEDTSAKYYVEGRPEGTLEFGGGVGKMNASSSWTVYYTAFESDARKAVLEYKVNATSGSYQVFPHSVPALNAARDNKITGTFYGVLDFDAETYILYDEDGNKISEMPTQSTSTLNGLAIYLAGGLQAEFGYFKMYEFSEKPNVLDKENADINNLEISIDVPVVKGTDLTDYITVNGFNITAVEEKDKLRNIYTVTLEENLDFETEYTVSMADVPLINGLTASGAESFTTRARKTNIDASIAGGVLVEGENQVTLTINNEKEASDAVFVCAYYSGDAAADVKTFPISTETGTIEKTITAEAAGENSSLELYVVENLESMKLIGGKKVYTSEGEASEQVIYPQDGVLTQLTPPSFDPVNNTGDFKLTMSDEATDCSVYLKITDTDDNILYLQNKKSTQGSADFNVKFPASDDAQTYKAYWGYNADDKSAQYPYEFVFYPMTYIENCFDVLSSAQKNSATDEEKSALLGITGAYGYKTDYTDEMLEDILYSVTALRIEKGGFTDSGDILKNVYTAEKLIIDKKNKTEDFIEAFHEEFKFNENAYELFNKKLSDTMKEKIIKHLKETPSYDVEETKALFLTAVIEKGLAHSSSYMQVREILKAIGNVMDIDEDDYEKYCGFTSTKKEIVENGLAGFSGNNLKEEFSDLVNEAASYKSTSGGGGGGGGGSSKKTSGVLTSLPVIETQTPDIKDEQPQDKEESKKQVFDDLDGFDWAYDAIASLSEKGIIAGTGENKFNPQGNITRREIAKIIALAYGLKSEKEADYADVSAEDWAAEYISAVSDANIMTGVDENSFAPDTIVTREMFATIVYRVMLYEGKALDKTEADFADKAEISSYAEDAVNALFNAQIINGVGENAFAPKLSCSRAQAAVMIYRALELI